jgi:hypothetical protein
MVRIMFDRFKIRVKDTRFQEVLGVSGVYLFEDSIYLRSKPVSVTFASDFSAELLFDGVLVADINMLGRSYFASGDAVEVKIDYISSADVVDYLEDLGYIIKESQPTITT